MSCEGRVPEAGLHVVEYPGIVADTEAAMATLGGAEAVSAALSGGASEQLHLRFRPDDPLCHPLIGVCGSVETGAAGSALVLQLSTRQNDGRLDEEASTSGGKLKP
jgi:general transcription factor 3C polypeptide 5 (transcription factor C subunit 1)